MWYNTGMNQYRKRLIEKAKKERCLYDAVHHSKNTEIRLAIWDAWGEYWGQVNKIESENNQKKFEERKLKMQQDAKRRREEGKIK